MPGDLSTKPVIPINMLCIFSDLPLKGWASFFCGEIAEGQPNRLNTGMAYIS